MNPNTRMLTSIGKRHFPLLHSSSLPVVIDQGAWLKVYVLWRSGHLVHYELIGVYRLSTGAT